jgi:hypothetical protein
MDLELEVEERRYAVSVSDYHTGTCSTAVVLGLSYQIAEEVSCIAPEALVHFEESEGIAFVGAAVLPYVSKAARDDLLRAASASGAELRITSGFRTVAQQYLLRRWFELGRCGITAAAQPGQSNHQSGRALDISNHGTWASILPSYGWAQTVPGDAVHFDHLASADNRGLDVLAFQRLWNANHPDDPIAEDGIYGPETNARLAAAPPGGFEIGACQAYDFGAELLAIDAPVRLDSGERAFVSIELRNSGGIAWTPETTYLATTGPMDRASELRDETWPSPGRPAAVAEVTAPGEVGRFEFWIRAPRVGDDAFLSEPLSLVDEENEDPQFFGPAELRLELDVAGDGLGGGVPPERPDGPDHHANVEVVGGCTTAAGSTGSLWLVLVLLAALRLSPPGRRAALQPGSPASR